MNWETYIAFGDSITIGARTYLGYPELTANLLQSKLGNEWNVVNCAQSRYKAIDLARHIDVHFQNLKSHGACLSTLLIGTNDVKENTPEEEFRIALNQIMLKVRMLTSNRNVVVMTIPEFHTGVMYPYTIDMNDKVKALNAVIADLASHHGFRLLHIEHTAGDFTDGVHLNADGNANFASQLSQFILKDKGIRVA